MKLRNGRVKKDYTKLWWFPFVKTRHKHHKHCYCSSFLSIKQWIQIDDEENLNISMSNLKLKNDCAI